MPEETALSTLAPLQLVPTQFRTPRIEVEDGSADGQESIERVSNAMVRTVIATCSSLLLAGVSLLILFHPWVPNVYAIISGLLMLQWGDKARTDWKAVKALVVRSERTPSDLSSALWALNDHITRWNSAAEIARQTPDVDARVLADLSRKRALLAEYREKALRCLALPTPDP